jgi:fatty-acyl-CoA synthase
LQDNGVGSWIQRRIEKSGEDIAIIQNGVSTSYGQLNYAINLTASALSASGIKPGDRVAFIGENHPNFLQCFFATLQLGAIFVPLNTRLAPPEIEFMLKDSGASLLLFAEPLKEKAKLAAELADCKCISVGNDANELARNLGMPASTEAKFHDFKVELADTAVILYTSGTTGRPKGAELTHQNLTWNTFNVLVDYDVVSTTKALVISPMFHVASLGMGVLPVLLKGGTILLEEKFDAGRALELIQTHGATSLSGVPTTFQMLSEHPNWETTDLSSITQLTCGGSAISLAVIEKYQSRGLSFTGGYGMTEAAPGVSSLPPTFSRAKVGSAGLPHHFTSIRIVSEETDSVVAPMEIGEIQVAGPNAIRSYWNNVDASESLYTSDGWMHTGDLGYLDESGFLFIVDRSKDMIISGGENIYPSEVEQLLLSFPGITAAAVVGVSDEKWGEVPVAVICHSRTEPIESTEVIDFLLPRIAKYKIPKQYYFTDELPRTASGKVKKNQIKQLIDSGLL